MGKVKSRVGSFRGKVSANTNKRKQGGSFSYLAPPNGVEVFTPEADNQYVVDFMVYQVSIKNHPDRDDKNGVAVKGDYWYKLPFKVHRNVGVRNEKVVCPQSFGKPCPICDYKADLKKNDGDEDEIKGLNTSDRNLYALRLPLDKKNKDKMFIYDASDYMFQEDFESQLKRDDRWETFIHPSEGCSVKLTFDEDSFAGHKFAKITRFDFEARKVQYDDSILDEVPNLDECLTVLSYDQLKAKFFEAGEEDDEEEEDEKPTKKSAKPTSKKPAPVEEDEDEEDEEEEEDDEEEEEEDEESLSDQINAAKKVSELIEIATDNPDVFKKSMKKFKTFTKASLLKAEMLAMVEPEEDEEDEEDEGDGREDIILEINDASDIPELLTIAKANPTYYKAHIKELREFTKVKLMKNRMVELINDDLPFDTKETEKTPSKKQEEPSRRRRTEDEPKESGKCPHGHKFGADNDEYNECDECVMWKECYKKSKEK